MNQLVKSWECIITREFTIKQKTLDFNECTDWFCSNVSNRLEEESIYWGDYILVISEGKVAELSTYDDELIERR